MAEDGVPALAVAFGLPGGTPWARGFGALPDGSTAVAAGTAFPAGSLSKPVLATITLAVASNGGFDLDRPLRDWLPGDDFPTGPGADRLTARHALRHQSGLPNWRFDPAAPFALQVEPGTRWSYSGEGVFLVQRALEAATGHGLEALARKHVFGPLGMSSSTFLWRDDLAGRYAAPVVPSDARMAAFAPYGERRARALVAWARDEGRDPAETTYQDAVASDRPVRQRAAAMFGEPLPDVTPLPVVLTPNAAGSLVTTVPDYLRFVHAWLENEDLRERAFDEPVAAADAIGWGVGWGLESGRAPACFWHWAEGVGFRAFALGDPRAGEGIVVLASGDEGLGPARFVVEGASGEPHPAFDFL